MAETLKVKGGRKPVTEIDESDLKWYANACNNEDLAAIARGELARRAAGGKVEQLRQDLAELAKQRSALLAGETATKERRRSAHAQAEEARGHFERVSARLAELDQIVTLHPLRAVVESTRTALDELSVAAMASAQERIGVLHDALDLIVRADTIETAHTIASSTLERDATTLTEAAARPAKLAVARKAVVDAQARLGAAVRRLRAGDVAAAKDQMAALKIERSQYAEAVGRAEAQAKKASHQLRAYDESLAGIGERERALTDQVAELRPVADRSHGLDAARGRPQGQGSKGGGARERSPPPVARATPYRAHRDAAADRRRQSAAPARRIAA